MGDEWGAELYPDRRGNFPVIKFLKEQGTAKIKARIWVKMEHLARIALEQSPSMIGRPLVDTIQGAIKELRVDQQVRILFSWEYAEKLVLMLEGTRKKNGSVDPQAVKRALEYRADWLKSRSSVPLPTVKQKLGVL